MNIRSSFLNVRDLCNLLNPEMIWYNHPFGFLGYTFMQWPFFDEEDIQAVATVLRSGKVNYWTGGLCRQFEKEFAQRFECRYAIALANGTVALECALMACGVGSGDEVITTSRTFVASASAIVMRGAIPVIADVDPDSQNITVLTIQKKLTPRTRAIIAVHLAGWPCDMDPIMTLAKKHGLFVIEDCAQAHGARYKGRSVGSLGHVAAFSFCQDKIMTTGGEGGMLTTNDEAIWKKSWSYKDHGKSYDAVYHREHPPGFRWLHESFGTNWRLTEMQAVLGLQQLKKLDAWLALRDHYAQKFNQAFESIVAFRLTLPGPEIQHAYYKYYVFVRPERLAQGWTRDRILNTLLERQVTCFSGSCSEIYLEQCFINSEFRVKERLPVAKTLGETSLMFLIHPTLTEAAIDQVILQVTQVMQEAMSEVSLSETVVE